jgi:hypothetical protein
MELLIYCLSLSFFIIETSGQCAFANVRRPRGPTAIKILFDTLHQAINDEAFKIKIIALILLPAPLTT